MTQPMVFRVSFNTENEVLKAQDQLMNYNIWADYIKDGDQYKLIFTEFSMATAKKAINKLPSRPRAEYFDPAGSWTVDTFHSVD
jgi:hypothetical protein